MPNLCTGPQLGQNNALLAAGVVDFATGLQLVKKRGELMSAVTSGGAMVAVIGLSKTVIQETLVQHNLQQVTIANENSHTQLVLSGTAEDLAFAQSACEQVGALLVIPLKVSGAFHSPAMQSAQNQFAHFLQDFQFSEPSIPVISNYTAEPYQPSAIVDTLTQQMTHPVLWTKSINYLLAQGETEFEEIGPGTVLSGLIRRIKNDQ